jgi:sarcosine oxidase delta subunit
VGTANTGETVKPGSYEAFDVEDYYWARLDDAGEVIDNYFGTAPRIEVTIQASDYGFHTEGCGEWTRIGRSSLTVGVVTPLIVDT